MRIERFTEWGRMVFKELENRYTLPSGLSVAKRYGSWTKEVTLL
jgi:hypothetical protein